MKDYNHWRAWYLDGMKHFFAEVFPKLERGQTLYPEIFDSSFLVN